MNVRANRRELLQTAAAFLGYGVASSVLPAEVEGTQLPKLTISSVETYLLHHLLRRPFGVSVSVPLSKTRETLLVKISTAEGLVGWGETSPISGTRATIEHELTPRLLGRNPLHYLPLWRDLWGANFGNSMAVGAVEIALNDLRGKILQLPVAELFGGRFRERVPVYVSALEYVEGAEIEEHYPRVAVEMVNRGHRAIKMRLGRHSVAREAAVAEKVRNVVGPQIKLMADGNGGYTMATALQMARRLHELDFEFFEEPLPQRAPDYTAYEELRRKMTLPLAAGEALDSRSAAKRLIDRRCMDIIQPDASLCGGIGEALFISQLASLSGIQSIPHCWGSDIAIAASLHLLALLPDPHWGLPTDTSPLELDQSENPWRDGLARTPFQVRDGFIEIPTKPGLGIDVNEDVVRRYAV